MKEKQRRERQQTRTILGHWLGLDRSTPRRRMEDHLRQQDDTKKRYAEERRAFKKSTDRRERPKGLKLELKPKGPSGPKSPS